MAVKNDSSPEQHLPQRLTYLQLPYTRDHFEDLAQQAAEQHWLHVQYLSAPSCRAKPNTARTAPFNAA
ncbi:MAG: hypothetical protein L0Y39_08950 [Methylococcaceae bacterium]|nr:hypothetical protein [Methylococcaceae bacterium]